MVVLMDVKLVEQKVDKKVEEKETETEKAVVGGEGKIVGANSGGVSLASGTSRHDEREFAITAGGDEERLLFHIINRIDDAVEVAA